MIWIALFLLSPLNGDELKVIEALQKDQIPLEMEEGMRMISPNAPESIEFESIVLDAIRKRFSHIPFLNQPIRVLISDIDAPNAFRIKHTKTLTIGITTGFLKKLKSLDQLAILLGHELVHGYLAQTYGEGDNSKGEELTADILPLYFVADAGFNIEEAIGIQDIIDEFRNDEDSRNSFQRIINTFQKLIDPHPTGPVERRAVLNTLSLIRLERGQSFTKPTALPRQIENIAKAQYKSSFQTFLENNHYEELNHNEKAAVLVKFLQESKRIGPLSLQQLGDEISKVFSDIRKSFVSSSVEKGDFSAIPKNDQISMHQLADAILGFNLRNDIQAKLEGFYVRMLYRKIFESEGKTSGEPVPLGTFFEINQEINTLLEMGDENLILSKAKQILEKLKYWSQDAGGINTWQSLKEGSLNLFKDTTAWVKLLDLAKRNPGHPLGELLFELEAPLKPLEEILTDQQILRLELRNSSFRKKGYLHFSSLTMGARFLTGNLYSLSLQRSIHQAFSGDKAMYELLKEIAENHLERKDIRIGELVGIDYFLQDPELILALNFPVLLIEHNLAEDDMHARRTIVEKLKEWQNENPHDFKNKFRRIFERQLLPVIHSQTNRYDRAEGKTRVPPENIYAQFYLSPQNNAFTKSEKIQFLEKYCIRSLRLWSSATKEPTISGFAPTPPERRAEILSVINNIRNILDLKIPSTPLEWITLTKKAQEKKQAFIITWLSYEFGYFLDENPKAASVFSAPELLRIQDNLINWESTESRTLDINTVQVSRCLGTRHDLFHLSTKITDAVDEWAVLSELSLFHSNPSLRYKLLDSLIDRINELPDAEQRFQLRLKILKTKRIEKPKIRQKIFDGIVDDTFARFDFDNSSQAYEDGIWPILEEIHALISGADRDDLLWDIAKRLRFQKNLSTRLKSLLLHTNRKKLEASHLFGFLGDSFLNWVMNDPPLGKAMVLFLHSSGQEPDIQLILEEIKKSYRLLEGEIKNGAFPNFYLPYLRKDEELKLDLQVLHENYRNFSFPWRTIVINPLLLPPGSENDKGFQNAFQFVLNHILKQNIPHAKERNEYLSKYLKVVPDYQRILYLSAIISASEKTVEDNSISAGQFLALVLKNMGPAEKKIAQAIHSHPSTSPEFKEDLRDVKTMTDPPHRGKLFEIYGKLPESLRSQIDYIEDIIGAASYWVVVKVRLKNGQFAALALMRPFSKEKAEDGFARASAFVNELDPSPMRETFRNHIQEAERSSKIETNWRLERKQYEIARQIYDSLNVEIIEKSGKSYQFHFRTTRILDSGEGYRLMTLAEGDSFNTLSDEPLMLERKKAWAKAITFVELSRIFMGLQTDEDRHGDQNKILGDTITYFDFGGISLEPPTKIERIALARLLMEAKLQSKKTGDSFAVLLTQKMRSHPSNAPGHAYILRTEKALLALNDFMKYLDSGDLELIMQAIQKSGLLHRDFAQEGLKITLQETWKHLKSLDFRTAKKILSPSTACKDDLIKFSTSTAP